MFSRSRFARCSEAGSFCGFGTIPRSETSKLASTVLRAYSIRFSSVSRWLLSTASSMAAVRRRSCSSSTSRLRMDRAKSCC